MRTDGTDPHVVVVGTVRAPEYSPDGRWIAFSGTPRGQTPPEAIWAVHPNGGGLHRLTTPTQPRFDMMPDWRPNGRQIVFRRCETDGFVSCIGSIYVKNVSAGSPAQPIRQNNSSDRPVYSPNGLRIAASTGDDFCSDIFTMSRLGTNERFVTHDCDTPMSTNYANWPSWQPVPGP